MQAATLGVVILITSAIHVGATGIAIALILGVVALVVIDAINHLARSAPSITERVRPRLRQARYRTLVLRRAL